MTMPPGKVRAISLHQPWASLVAEGHKTVETRSWGTTYRGPLAIHAAKSTKALDYLVWLGEHLGGLIGEDVPTIAAFGDRITASETPRGLVRAVHDLPLGAFVATCLLRGCVRTERIQWEPERFEVNDQIVEWATTAMLDHADVRVAEEQRPYGDFRPGRWAWLLSHVSALPEPVPAVGRQGLFSIRHNSCSADPQRPGPWREATVEAAIRGAWDAVTSNDGGWSPALPERGQCAVSALAVQDAFGGELLRATVGDVSHYWNRLPNGKEIDLTRAQFEIFAPSEVSERTREYVLSFPDTMHRYRMLLSRMALLKGIQ